jgi:hypothetical protein
MKGLSLMSRIKNFWINVSVFVLACFVGLVISEVVLRLMPTAKYFVSDFGHVPHERLGWVNPSGVESGYASRDFDVTISFNSFGMRDKPRSFKKNKRYRIAVLGDSMVQAIQVPDDAVFTRLMEKAVDKIEVLNFGVSGYGTTQELLMYEILVERFNPDLVVVMANGFNDPFDNSIRLQELGGGASQEIHLRPFYVKGPQGELTLVDPILPEETKKKSRFRSVKSFLKKFLIVRLGNDIRRDGWTRVWGSFNRRRNAAGKHQAAVETKIPLESVSREIEKREKSPDWQEAWALTAEIFKLFAEKVKENGSQLVIVSCPSEPVDIVQDTEKLSALDENLKHIAGELGVDFWAMTPDFRYYIQEKKLDPPHLHFTRDGHWRDLGHRVVADSLLKFLKTKNIINGYRNVFSDSGL